MLFSGGGWAAVDRGTACEAASVALDARGRGRPPAIARFAFSRDHRRWGEFSARLSRPARAGSSIITTIGDERFLLVGAGAWAWSRGALQEQAMLGAVRGGGAMRVEARDPGGRRIVDHFALAGAATAVDAAAAGCAGKIARQ